METSIESLKEELASARARIKELNDESAGRRVAIDKLKSEHEASLAKLTEDLKGRDEKIAASEKTLAETREGMKNVQRDAALRMAARDAGIVDPDGLKLLDTSTVKVAEDGSVEIPAKFFDAAKEAKPWLFQQTGAQKGTTSSTAKAPAHEDTSPKAATAMNPTEYAALKASLGIRT